MPRPRPVISGARVRPLARPGQPPAQVPVLAATDPREDFTTVLDLPRPVPRACWSSSPTAG
ncbi:hypothetical protein [Actinomadura nitritigenes]|uniref:hypothetical protein n=1 Tax=Actinomadura nitritigenes TaxID=134602 RepID=UPI003D8C0581